jgi:hypothetical protein
MGIVLAGTIVASGELKLILHLIAFHGLVTDRAASAVARPSPDALRGAVGQLSGLNRLVDFLA